MKVEVEDPPPYEEAAGIKLDISEHGSNNFLVSVIPPHQPEKTDKGDFKRAPLDLCCVIDVSGSMEESAPAQSEDGKTKEDTGLTILDVVKHAMKTIIATLNDDDRLAIVAFDTRAELITDFQYSTASGKGSLNGSVDRLEPKASTNLWDGLKMGMNLLHDLQHKSEASGSSTTAKKANNRLASLFILTDGQPNVNPPRGHIPMLQQWLESHPDTRFAINGFGFGYDLDSSLMSDIARTGGGHYGFIADAGMVGTVFVHALANLFSTYATTCHLNVEVPDGAKVKKPRGEFPFTESSWGAKIDIGDIQYGQSRDFIIEIDGLSEPKPEDIIVTLVAKPWESEDVVNHAVTITTSPEPNDTSRDYEYHLHRLNFVTTVYALAKDAYKKVGQNLTDALKEVQAVFEEQSKAIKENLGDHPAAEPLGTDIGGEGLLAVAPDGTAWKKWGRHYFPSLARAHQMQRCNNFKDPGLQVYGKDSPLFIKSRDFADAEFDKLPPPTPSSTPMPDFSRFGRGARGGGGFASAPRVALSSMSRYNVRGGVCFTGDSPVTLSDGTKVRIDTLRRGSFIMTGRGVGEVSAIVKTRVSGTTDICMIGDMKVTPWHPIHYDGAWRFPVDLLQPQEVECEAVYSVLMMPSPYVEDHSMYVDAIQVVTLGHGLVNTENVENDVRNHEFFGNYSAVFDGLRELKGFYEDGVCECEGVLRDAETGLIKGFAKSTEKRETLVDTVIGQPVRVHS
ncbi:hypothetical protein TWF788_000577 [Orbilia oligospora]|uniref:VWFA domain-containing protein n=1 Tax=Orbilia oligospora TaxID=2813651 RepID=A0A6G1MJX0_ORBOL|nr:hypothetical protein TWF788_000577 [Orbilia oligospora]KAF3207316.1 hypothetical protein TWF679_008387 [Orbilia oligospora]KAF3230399.1 hypothetical protein TWF191_010286 [Orbilia oligospora]KAF3260485.1 hypothetical protein TWF192_009764 [Orbilia oligospora]